MQPVFDAKPGDPLELAEVVRDHDQVTRPCLARNEQIKRTYGLSPKGKRGANFACGNCIFLIQLKNGKVPQEQTHGFEIVIDPLTFVGTIIELVNDHD
jgi:hypothetical protein